MNLNAQAQHLYEKVLDVLRQAEAEGDRGDMLKAVREARGVLEMYGKVTGQFQSERPRVEKSIQSVHLHKHYANMSIEQLLQEQQKLKGQDETSSQDD